MKPDSYTPRRTLAGSTILISGVDSPLGAAIARRLAAHAGSMVMASAKPIEECGAIADVDRVRLLSGQYGQSSAHHLNASTDGDAEKLFAVCREHAVHLDAVIHIASPTTGGSTKGLSPLMPMLRVGCAELEQQERGRIVLVLDLTSSNSSRFSARARAGLDEIFEAGIRAAARSHFARDICINGLIVQPGEVNVERSLAITMGGRLDGEGSPTSSDVYSSAAGVVELLASASSCGITGQVFRIGGRPLAPQNTAELTATRIGSPA